MFALHFFTPLLSLQLKTLEEPPQHVIFILCTTEPQKIPLTIHSRCQRFDFKSITTKDIIGKLKEIVALENLNVEEEALNQIAIHAEGGLRDAISLLDQASSYSPEKITLEDVNQISGAVSAQMLLELAEALIQGNSTKAIEVLNALITEGKEVRKINLNLIEFFRDILMVRNLRNLDENNFLYRNEQFIQLSKMISNKMTIYILDVLIKAANEIKWSNSPKIYLELAFIKITDNEISSNSRLISMIDDIENRLSEVEKIKDDIDEFKEKESENLISEIVHKAEETEDKDILKDVEIDEEIGEEEITEETQKETFEKQVCEDVNDTYSIEFVENILNNGNRQDKSLLINTWHKINKTYANEEEKYISQILETGTVVASSVESIIITFPSVSICNKLMSDSNKQIAKTILEKHYNRSIDFIALPDSVFGDIANEFKNLWNQNKNEYIKLSKIQCEGLTNVSNQDNNPETENKPKIITDALELFGDIVKVKK